MILLASLLNSITLNSSFSSNCACEPSSFTRCFATPKHLVKEDGSQAQLDEKLEFKVIEFNKDAKRIILSHSRIFEDVAKAEERAEKKAASGAKKSSSSNKREDSPMIQNQAASTTLGDIDALAALKEQLEGKK